MDRSLYIVCVDDEKIVLDSLNTQLSRKLGDRYAYEFAQSGEEALEVIQEILEESDQESIYVVISDWLMPGMKGDELLHKVREKIGNVKTILLSGHVDSAVFKELKNNSLIHCVQKPWSEQELINLITS